MKNQFFYILLFFSASLILESCSRCYKCSSEVIISVNGVNDTNKVEQDVCTANSKEIQDKEKEGYSCVAN